MDWQKEITIEVDSGTLALTAYARDQSGNAPTFHFSAGTGNEATSFSMSLEQAERFVEALSDLTKELRGRESI